MEERKFKIGDYVTLIAVGDDKECKGVIKNLPKSPNFLYEVTLDGGVTQFSDEMYIIPLGTDTQKKQFSDISPSYYNDRDIEPWEMMVKIWGNDAFVTFCELNAFKYRMRIGNKPGQSAEKELGKIKWYEDKIKEIKNGTK